MLDIRKLVLISCLVATPVLIAWQVVLPSQPPSPSLTDDRTHSDTPANKLGEDTHPKQLGTNESPLIVETHSRKDDQAEAAEKDKDRKERESDKRRGEFITWATIAVAILQTVLIGLQLRVFERQADLMKGQGELTKTQNEISTAQAQIMGGQVEISIGIERAWIVDKGPDGPTDVGYFSSGRDGLNMFKMMTITNVGKTPGNVLVMAVRFHTLSLGEALPEDPLTNFSFNDEVRSIPINGLFIAPALTEQVALHFHRDDESRITQTEVGSIRDGKLQLVLYGFIKYEDSFKIVRYTHFCYFWTPKGENHIVPSGYLRGGPPKYNQAT